MSKHTPGYWIIHPDGFHVGPQGKPFVAYITPCGNMILRDDRELHQANANLIAAAPELLEALDALVKSHAPDANFPAVNNARIAIAKARGEK